MVTHAMQVVRDDFKLNVTVLSWCLRLCTAAIFPACLLQVVRDHFKLSVTWPSWCLSLYTAAILPNMSVAGGGVLLQAEHDRAVLMPQTMHRSYIFSMFVTDDEGSLQAERDMAVLVPQTIRCSYIPNMSVAGGGVYFKLSMTGPS